MQLGSLEPPNVATTSAVQQTIALPDGAGSIVLSFAYYPVYTGMPSAGDYQTGIVLDETTGQPLATVLTGQLNTGQWQTGRFNLTPLAGKEVALTFAVVNDGVGGQMAMYIDQVSVTACATPSLPIGEQAAPVQTAMPQSRASQSESGSTPAPATPVLPAPTAAPSTLAPLAAAPTIVTQPAACDCNTQRYTCADFSSWAAAQVCLQRCEVIAGYDVHGLDPDHDGVACELSIRGIAPYTQTAASLSGSMPVPLGVSPAAPTAQLLLPMPGTQTPPVQAHPALTSTPTIAITATVAGTGPPAQVLPQAPAQPSSGVQTDSAVAAGGPPAIRTTLLRWLPVILIVGAILFAASIRFFDFSDPIITPAHAGALMDSAAAFSLCQHFLWPLFRRRLDGSNLRCTSEVHSDLSARSDHFGKIHIV